MLKIMNLAVSIEEKAILKNFSLEIQPGTIHALMGPNGSGKSTLAATLMGHMQPTLTAGSIFYNGHDITRLSPDKRAQLGIFLAFQTPLEIPGVTLATFLKEAHQAITGNQMTVADFMILLNEKLALLKLDPSFAHRNLNEGCSGGERKKIELLQMLVLNPSLIILDEIDSGLDIDALHSVAQAINSMQSNPHVSVLIITHYQRILNVIQPDFVHIVHDGTIIRSGGLELAQLLESKGYHGAIAH